MPSLPTIAVRNALAFVDRFGDFPRNLHMDTRLACSRYTEFNNHDAERQRTGRNYYVTDEGKALVAKSTLAGCLEHLKAAGFRLEKRDGWRMPKPGYMPFKNDDTGEVAFISSGRRVYRPGPEKHRYIVVFEGKTR